MRALRARIGSASVDQRRPDGCRQLLVDVSTIARGDAGTGIQRVVRALWLELKLLEGESLIVTPVIGSRRSSYRVAPANFLLRPVQDDLDMLVPAKIAAGDIFLGLDLAAHIVPYRGHDLKRWQRQGVQLAFVVYDLLPALRPQWFSAKSRRKYLRWMRFVLRHADQVVCIAKAVQQDLENWIDSEEGIHARRPRIAVMRLSGDLAASHPSSGLPANADDIFAWAETGRTILMVGTIEPRKGYDQALAAFEHLWATGDAEAPKLLIVGRPGWMTEQLQQQIRQHPEQGQRLVWISDASDEYLEQLYARSYGLLFASRAEGFGLPLIEAAMRGKPALARDLPVFREFTPSGTTFFACDGADELAETIAAWTSDLAHAPATEATFAATRWNDTIEDLCVALNLEPAPESDQ